MGVQIVICLIPNHVHCRRGDIESIYTSGKIEYGLGYKPNEKLILEIDNITRRRLLTLVRSLEPEYLATDSSKRGRVGLKARNTITNDPEEWTEIKRPPRNKINLESIIGDDQRIAFLKIAGLNDVITELTMLSVPCFHKQILELRV